RLGPLRHARVRPDRGVRRRAHGGPHTRVPRQEDRSPRDEDGLAHGAAAADPRAGRHRCLGRGARGTQDHLQPGHPRLQRSAVRVLLGIQQQRQRLRGSRRQHALVQRHAGRRDVLRALLARRAGARHRRLARRQEARADRSGHVADAHAAVRGAADRDGARGGRRDLFTRIGARPDRRASRDGGSVVMSQQSRKRPLFDPPIVRRAALDAFLKLDPRQEIRNPVMFVVLVASVLTTALGIQALGGHGEAHAGFILGVAAWLWFTLLFANFAEAMAEGRGKAQAEAMRRARTDLMAKKLVDPKDRFSISVVPAPTLRRDDVFVVAATDVIPCDGEVLGGVASVDESAITGESAPVIRESGGDRSTVTGGTRILSDWLVVRVTADPGETFLDRMIAMVEGAKRQKTPNEIALTILLVALTLVFLFATATLLPFSSYAVSAAGGGAVVTVTVLVALLVCLIPTTIGGLLSAIGIAGMDRLLHANVMAMSGRAVEAAGDVDVLLLDKTGTITLGNRQATELLPAEGVEIERLADAAQLASLSDETPEGRSIVVLAKERYKLRE